MSRTPGLFTKDELKSAMNEQAERVFPILHKNGNFICFMDWASYAHFVAVTGTDLGTYMDENMPEWFEKNKNFTAADVDRLSMELIDKVGNKDEEKVRKIAVEIMLKMHNKQDYAEQYKKKYPRTFFSNLYPLDLV